MEQSRLHRFCLLLAACTLFLVVAGASVTSNEAGLSVPDWPLSYGKVMPEMKGGVFFEHGHRMIASTVGLLTVILAVWLWRAEPRRWMRNLGLAALGAVILQGVLGGLTVLLMLPPAVSIAHACLAQLFFSTTVAFCLFTSKSWLAGPQVVTDAGWPSLRTLSILNAALVLCQVALGAGFRHRAFGIMPHVIGAMLVSGVVLIVAIFVLNQFGDHAQLRAAAFSAMGLTLVQVLLGLGAYLQRASSASAPSPELVTVIVTVVHVATGALTLAASIALAIEVHRHVVRPGQHSQTVSNPHPGIA